MRRNLLWEAIQNAGFHLHHHPVPWLLCGKAGEPESDGKTIHTSPEMGFDQHEILKKYTIWGISAVVWGLFARKNGHKKLLLLLFLISISILAALINSMTFCSPSPALPLQHLSAHGLPDFGAGSPPLPLAILSKAQHEPNRGHLATNSALR